MHHVPSTPSAPNHLPAPPPAEQAGTTHPDTLTARPVDTPAEAPANASLLFGGIVTAGLHQAVGRLQKAMEAAAEDTLSTDPAAETEHPPTAEVAPPPGFTYNPQLVVDYAEQIELFNKEAARQAAPSPSFENTPEADIKPTFNPTNAPPEEVYVRNRCPERMRRIGSRPHSEFEPERTAPLDLWRIEERPRITNGQGLVASKVLAEGGVGDIEGFKATRHYSSNYEDRTTDASRATPLISFTTDPEHLAKDLILQHGFGIRDGRDSVVMRVQVDPSRVLTSGKVREQEVYLLGGVAPDEYKTAYEVGDFIPAALPSKTPVNVRDADRVTRVTRDEALAYWRTNNTA